MLKVALTGGIGSGKSEAGALFAGLGAVVIDSDVLAREVVERGTPGFEEVVGAFGDEILSNGEIDRKKLADLVFNNDEKRKRLEAIIHPKVRAEFEKVVQGADTDAVIINLIPLLVETKGYRNFDSVITISVPFETRKSRLIKRGMKEYEIDARVSSQASDSDREEVADFVLDNSGDLSHLQEQIEKIYTKLKADATKN